MLFQRLSKGQERIEAAEVNNKTAQYLYNDGDKFYFMDPTSFEQFELAAEIVDDASKYLKEGDEFKPSILRRSSD